MAVPLAIESVLSRLNPQQREAATHGRGPLLIIAGAGTGKTTTLAHRVAHQIAEGTAPGRILLLTFTRRASAEMLRRVDSILREMQRAAQPPSDENDAEASDSLPRETDDTDPTSVTPSQPATASSAIGSKVWGGTFHSVATRLLRQYGQLIGLPNDFTILDRSDSEDLMQVLRQELKLGQDDEPAEPGRRRKRSSRFPLKGTCVSIYSRVVNTQLPLRGILEQAFPWCLEHEEKLKELFNLYVDRKEEHAVLDYDDLLLFWKALMEDERSAAAVRRKFDCVLVDEYQDTNVIQSGILKGLTPDGEDSPSSATTPSRSTHSVPPPSATSSTFPSTSPAPPSSSSNTTTAARSPSSKRPTASSPRPGNDTARTSSPPARRATPAACPLPG
ncbi:MAG: ATP-dependent helicase [Planctomycetaceae bacterium]